MATTARQPVRLRRVTFRVVDVTASSLLERLFDEGCDLAEVVRTRDAVHYETGRDDVPVLCVGTARAVRLPASVTTSTLPTVRVRGQVRVVDGSLTDGSTTWQVTRWWRPPRPRGLTPPADVRTHPHISKPGDITMHGDRLSGITPHALVGLGPGLTPSGDDVLAGALVSAHATSDPRLEQWQRETRAALGARHTTAVSRGLLHHALDGYATPELAAFVEAVCAGDVGDVDRATPALLAVGHTSGAALAAGVLHVLSTHPARRVAA